MNKIFSVRLFGIISIPVPEVEALDPVTAIDLAKAVSSTTLGELPKGISLQHIFAADVDTMSICGGSVLETHKFDSTECGWQQDGTGHVAQSGQQLYEVSHIWADDPTVPTACSNAIWAHTPDDARRLFATELANSADSEFSSENERNRFICDLVANPKNIGVSSVLDRVQKDIHVLLQGPDTGKIRVTLQQLIQD